MTHSGKMSRWTWLMAMVALLAIFAVACSGDDDDDSSSAGFTDAGYKTAGLDKARVVTIDGDIPIGISSALTGEVAGLGIPIADSAEVASEGVTIKGKKIKWVREDDLCSPEGGPAAADRLVKANVVAAIGPICSGGTRASLKIFDDAGITHISPSATAGDLTTPTRPEGPYVTFFRVPVLNADEAKAQAQFAYDTLKAKKAFVVFDTDDYGKDLAAEFQKSFKAEGGEIVGTPAGYEKKTTDFKSIIANIKAAKPDVIYQAGFYAEATPFLQQLRADADLKSIPYIGGDGIKNDELLSGAKDAAEGAYLALPGTTGSQFDTYKQKYAAKFKGNADSATFGAEAYDAATAILKALDKVAVEKGGKLEIDLKKLNEEIKKSSFEGASGKVEFQDNGNRAGAVVRLFKVVGGKYVQLEAGKK
ncbi:branched-chain amino acid ABC transporter substrate-binding protein [Candidatus Amarobacter glycogenicus]|uniref:branched-chain amino acid ABC transporter substrate-binding protein n=1 Tax=Candidatus Amarobacter glycogenicus TaxID=3140699 RepID=UPI0031354D49|nr:branched-chain amino acid ABC transporter substrate-binding protein [Dehalococcoidia bacterium]